MARQYQVISKRKLLCSSKDYDLLCRGCRLFYRRRGEQREHALCSLTTGAGVRLLSAVPMAARLLRLEPRCGLFLTEDVALVCWHGGVWRVSVTEGTAREEHRFRPGMSSPLTLTPVRDNPGFADCVLYGDYINDGAVNAIQIWRRPLDGDAWEPVFSFAPGSVKHIHSILSCPQRESLIVFTGDTDEESGIWEIRAGFAEAGRIAGGSQQYRACAGFVVPEGIVYATDAPNRPNALFFCGFDGRPARELAALPGPAIYGAPAPNGGYVLSTSVEGALDRGLRSWFSYRLGDGVRDRYSHVLLVDRALRARELLAGKKDWLPMRLFGFGSFQFPQGERENVVVSAQALKGLDGKTLQIQLEE